MVIIFNIAIEVPNVNSITLTNSYYLTVVRWVEEHAYNGIGVTNEALEKVWCSFLSLVVPHSDHTVLAGAEKIP